MQRMHKHNTTQRSTTHPFTGLLIFSLACCLELALAASLMWITAGSARTETATCCPLLAYRALLLQAELPTTPRTTYNISVQTDSKLMHWVPMRKSACAYLET